MRVVIHNGPGFIENRKQENPLVLGYMRFKFSMNSESAYKMLCIRIRQTKRRAGRITLVNELLGK